MVRFVIILFCLSHLIPVETIAQAGSFGPKPFVINYTKSEYQADNQNWSSAADSAGIVYFGNHAGLLSFDGSNWELFHLPEESVVRSVAEGQNRKIYVGAYEEFGYFKTDERGQKHYISLSDSLDQNLFHNDEIWRIVLHQGKVYFQSFTSIFVYDGENVEPLNPQSAVVLLLKARKRLFIHMIGEGLFEIKDQSFEFIEGSGFLRNDEIKMMLPHGDNQFLVGAANNGLFIYDGESFMPWKISSARAIKEAEINCGIALDDGYAIGTIVKGIFILRKDGTLKYHLNTENSLQNNTVLSISKDHSGNLWVGLDRGIDYIDLNPPLDFYIDKSGELGSVYAAALYDGHLWIGTNRGLYKYQNNHNSKFSEPRMIDGTQGQVWSLDVFGNQLICGHNNGTFSVSPQGGLTRLSDINGGFHIKKVTFDNSEVLLQSTYSNLVIYEKTEGNQWVFSRTIEGFIEPVPVLELDHKGNIWASHLNEGVFRIQLNSRMDSAVNIRYYNNDNGFKNDREIQVSKIDGRIVFATGSKLYTYDDLNDTIVDYTQLNRQVGSFHSAHKITRGLDDNYWFVDKNKIALFRIKSGSISRLFNYNLYQQGLYMSSEYPEIISLNDSLHLICLDNGFAMYQKHNVDMIESGEVVMRKIRVSSDKGEVKYLPLEVEKQPVSLPSNCRNLTFTYSTTRKYVHPIYRYKLKGLEESRFSDWNNQSEVNFSRLPAGEYIFIVQSKNVYGKVSNTLTYPFEILPPWYATNVAFTIYAFLLLGMGWYFRYLFLRRLHKHKARLEKEEKEKRERERMMAHQQLMKVKNEKLQSELEHKNVELANHTMNVVNKNDLLMRIKSEIKNLKKELGPRFPNYHYRSLLKIIDQNISSEDEWKTFEAHFDEIHESFFKRLMNEYPDLTQSDLKLCAYLRMNLSTKEIAPLLNISIRGVEARRYRLRKRLNLDHDANLVEFLLQF